MTVEELKKLDKLSENIKLAKNLREAATGNMSVRFSSSSNEFLLNDKNDEKIKEIRDIIYMYWDDKHDDLTEQFDDLVLCTMETSETFKRAKL